MSGACSPPRPSRPWQTAHLSSNVVFPLGSDLRTEALFSPLGFWQKTWPIPLKSIRTNPTLRTTRQVTSKFSYPHSKGSRAQEVASIALGAFYEDSLRKK